MTMSTNSRIEWTESTWNPLTGCTKVSPGCKHCYAERMAARLKGMGVENYRNGFELTLHPHVLEAPLTWSKPRMVFVNSMSDLFHPDVPPAFIQDVFSVMRKAHWHTFQVLTKRSKRLVEMNPDISWPDNVWMGVSVETPKYLCRVTDLCRTHAAIRFLSLEPLLEPLPTIPLKEVDWVIVGGESGPGARPMEREWVVQIRDQCVTSGTPFFFKQWGGRNKKKNGRRLDGRTWDQMPALHAQMESHAA
jgi:protein gp37